MIEKKLNSNIKLNLHWLDGAKRIKICKKNIIWSQCFLAVLGACFLVFLICRFPHRNELSVCWEASLPGIPPSPRPAFQFVKYISENCPLLVHQKFGKKLDDVSSLLNVKCWAFPHQTMSLYMKCLGWVGEEPEVCLGLGFQATDLASSFSNGFLVWSGIVTG